MPCSQSRRRDVAGSVHAMKLVLIALTLAACGSKSKDPTTACADAAKHGVDAMINQARGRLAGTPLPEDVKARIMERQARLEKAGSKMRAVFTNRCVDDKWSTTVLGCYMKVTSLEDMRACRKLLTAEQQARLQKDELELLAGGASPPGLNQSSDPFRAPKDPRIDFVDRAINDARKLVADAKTPEDEKAARDQLAALEGEKKQLEQQIAATTTPEAIAALEQEVALAKAKLEAASEKDREVASASYFRAMDELSSAKNRQRVAELSAKLEDIEKRVAAAVDRAVNATLAADRAAATAELETLRAEHDKLKLEFQRLISAAP